MSNRRSALFLISLVFACATVWAGPIACPTAATSLSTYVAAGYSCTVADKLLSGFTISSGGQDASGILVTPDTTVAGNPGLIFIPDGNWKVDGNGKLQETYISYVVTVLDSNFTIVAGSLNSSADVDGNGNGVATFQESFCPGGGFSAAGTCAAGAVGPITDSGSQSISSQTILGVLDYVRLESGTGSGQKYASVNSFSNNLLQADPLAPAVPEPVSAVLMGVGLLGLGLLRRLLKRS